MTTAAAIQQAFLDAAMDARAENLAQGRLVNNQTLECDSLLEHLQELDRLVNDPRARAHLLAALKLIAELVASNVREGEHERQIAGKADQLVTDLRRAEHHPQPPALWTAKKVARALRDPLAVLCNPVINGRRRADALAAVGRVIAEVPTAMLQSPTVQHELRAKKYRRLLEIHAELSVRAAA